MILVAGATGDLGREICRRLAAQGERVRGLVSAPSDAAMVAHLQSLGVETMAGDLQDRASLAAACREAWAVISTATIIRSRQAGDTIEDTDPHGQLNLVGAAGAAKTGSFIYVSYPAGNDRDDPAPPTVGQRTVEQRLRESGMTYTILQASPFMEVWFSPTRGFDYAHAKATLYGSGQNKISWISLADVAQFAVESLDNPAASNATLALGGPAALSPLEVVRIFEEVGGRPFAVQHAPEEALQEQKDDAIDMRMTLEAFPMKLTSVRDYAARVLMGH